MLLEISDSIIKNGSVLTPSDKECLKNILHSYKRGEHIVLFERPVLASRLTSMFKKNSDIINIIENINEKRDDSGSIRQLVNTFIRVNHSESDFLIEEKNQQKVFNVPLKYFLDNIRLTSIVSENRSDCLFFSSISECSKKNLHTKIPRYISLKFDNDPGGGSQSFEQYENKAFSERRITLCICDSDKKTSEDKYGNTAKSVEEIHDKMSKNSVICDYYFPDVREKENLVPPSYYINHKNFKNNSLLQTLSKLENNLTYNEKIKYLKISENNEKTEDFIEEIGLSRSINYSIGKSGLERFSIDVIYTEELAKLKLGLKQDKSAFFGDNEIFKNFYSCMPDYIIKEHQKLTLTFISWTCSYNKLVFN